MSCARSFPSSGVVSGRRDIQFILTIDTEADDQWSDRGRAALEVANLQHLPRLQALCDEFGFPPTYLCTYEVVVSDAFQDLLSPWQREGRAEIGAHLHPWSTPPLPDTDGIPPPTYPHELTPSEFRAKLTRLTDAIAERSGVAPTSYRAGRWGFAAEHVPILRAQGYRTDCSVTPLVSWADSPGERLPGPDFRDAPVVPYELCEENVLHSGRSGVLEVPVSILPKRRIWNRYPNAHRVLLNARWGLVGRIVRHLTGVGSEWLRPYPHMSASRLQRVARNAEARGLPVLELMCHSSEFRPGASPYNETEADVERLFEKLMRLFGFLADRGWRGARLADVSILDRGIG